MAFVVWNFQEERISRDARRDEATNPEKQIDEGPPGPLGFFRTNTQQRFDGLE